MRAGDGESWRPQSPKIINRHFVLKDQASTQHSTKQNLLELEGSKNFTLNDARLCLDPHRSLVLPSALGQGSFLLQWAAVNPGPGS